MKVLFVIVKTIEPGERHFLAAGICYVASAVKQAGHQTFGLNLSRAEDQHQALSDAILNNGIEVICISGLSKDYNDVEFITNYCKLVKPGICIIVGGHLVSSEPELVVQNLDFDFGVIGPGEETIVELLAALNHPSDERLREILGLAYKKTDGTVVLTETRFEVDDLDSLPYPDFPLLYDAEIQEFGNISITASRGCPFKCTFCSRSNSARYYQQRSLDAMFAELDYWLGLYDLKTFAILDDLFAATPERLREFCKRVKKYGLPFDFQSRVDIMTEELFSLLKDAGCQTICFGLESINDGILNSMQKRITVDQVDRAIQMTKKYDMRLVGCFIFGDVEETWETANESLNYWIANEAKTDIYLTPICLHPGTKLYEIACEKGIIRDKLQFLKDGCPLLNVSRMSDDQVTQLHKRIEHLLSIKDRPLGFSLTKVRPDSRVDLVVECMSCKRKHEISIDLAADSRY
ncbi:MAG: radical SAM protein, partial [Planctomycetota bacterium]